MSQSAAAAPESAIEIDSGSSMLTHQLDRNDETIATVIVSQGPTDGIVTRAVAFSQQ